eukprot:366426-Chlamydomonas_euryale.AAC.18
MLSEPSITDSPPFRQEVIAHLQDGWADTCVRAGDTVNVVGVEPRLDVHGGPMHMFLDSAQGLLVLHPDVLLSGEVLLSVKVLFSDEVLLSGKVLVR